MSKEVEATFPGKNGRTAYSAFDGGLLLVPPGVQEVPSQKVVQGFGRWHPAYGGKVNPPHP